MITELDVIYLVRKTGNPFARLICDFIVLMLVLNDQENGESTTFIIVSLDMRISRGIKTVLKSI